MAGHFSSTLQIKLRLWSAFYSLSVVFPWPQTVFKELAQEPRAMVAPQRQPFQPEHHQHSQPLPQARQQSVELNKRILGALSWEEVLSILRSTSTSVVNGVNVATAFHRAAKLGAQARPRPQEADLEHIISLIDTKFDEFGSREVANTLWAYATLGLAPSATVLGALSTAVERLAGAFNAQNVANTLWAFAVLHTEPPSILASRASVLGLAFGDKELEQISYAYLVGHALGWSVQLPNELVQRALSVQRRIAQEPNVSRLQQRVYEALQVMGQQPKLEALTEDGLFSIDIALPESEQDHRPKTAVEVDGPQHFTSTGGKTGSTQLRDFFREQRGWRVVSLPYFAIDAACKDEKLKEYLAEALARG